MSNYEQQEELSQELGYWVYDCRSGDSDKLVELWNMYCDTNHYDSDRLYKNEEQIINALLVGKTPYQVVLATTGGNYDPHYSHVRVDDDGLLTSCDPLDMFDEDQLDSLAEWLLEHKGADWLESVYGIVLESNAGSEEE